MNLFKSKRDDHGHDRRGEVPAKRIEFVDHFGITEAAMSETFSAALAHGARFSDIYFEHTITNTITMEEGIVKEAEKKIHHGAGVRAVRDESAGYAYVEDITPQRLVDAAAISSSITDSVATENPKKLETVEYTDRYPVRELTTTAPLKKKIAWIEEAEKAAKSYDIHVKKVTVSLIDQLSYIQIATSEGRLLRDVRPLMRIIVTVVAEKGGNRQMGISSGGGRIGTEYFLERSSPAHHGREAARQAVLLLDAVNAPAGPMELILSPAESGILLHESVGHPLEADFIRKGTSAYTGRIGDKVASELVTVIDDGTVENDRGALNFDDEGSLSSRTVLIEKGILKGYMHDLISASYFKTAPTGNGRRESYMYPPIPRMTVTYLANGRSDPEEIMKSTKKGIYCKSFLGGQVDISNGDFVFSPIEAYLVEDGEIKVPVKNLTIIGNGPDVLSKVTMVGNDFALSDGRWTCGKGQNVPVGVGLPTLKISQVTIGGSSIQ